MSSNEFPWHEFPGVLSSDEDDFMDLEALEMLEEKGKMPQRTSKMSGQEYVTFLLKGHPRTIKDVLRVDKHTFRALVRELIQRGQIEWDHKKVSIEESLAMFLYICGHSERHRLAADKFQHSTSTISDHFNMMRRALSNLAPYIIKPPNLEETPPEILHDDRYYPWFKDCVGAIDGTHIQAAVPNEMETAFRGRKGTKTQNVMVVCSFDMKFTFVYPGWEGSAHDGRVFLAAVTNPAFMFPHPPVNGEWEGDSDGDAGQVEHVNTSRQSVEMMGNKRDQMAMDMWEAY
ncbi:hypothetical protein Vadar_033047 [Vaccinium darrowii]|uniref:Uncharacterized protein n=1 Tax=Vaccinium darrowii TaxID=229202 RepID=A0ACB7Z811_9ERIC|nr:hypothetical protein Vadar_033047 [Vaccinium darrowii]